MTATALAHLALRRALMAEVSDLLPFYCQARFRCGQTLILDLLTQLDRATPEELIAAAPGIRFDLRRAAQALPVAGEA